MFTTQTFPLRRRASGLLLIGLLSAIAAHAAQTKPAAEGSLELRQTGYKLVNPLLECEVGRSGSKELRPFQQLIEKAAQNMLRRKEATHVSAYFRDLNNGPWIGVNEDEKFSPASLLKVPLMMTYLKMAESAPELLSRTLRYDPSREDDNASAIFKPSEAIKPGESYTVEELLRFMIARSDNNAKNILFDAVDREALAHTFYDLGVSVPNPSKPEDFMSVKEYASFFRILYNATYLERAFSEKALGLMAESDFSKGLTAAVPRGITVAHKFGERHIADTYQLHHCGIVYFPRHPYLLCVLTRGKDIDMLADDIREISALVYGEVDRQF